MGAELNDELSLSQVSFAAVKLSDEELIASLKECVMRGRRWEARMLVHMGEVDARKLYRDQAVARRPRCGWSARAIDLDR